MEERAPFRIGDFLLTEEEVRRRKAYLEIRPEDEEILRRAHPHLTPHVGAIIEEFYAFLLSQEHTRRLLAAPGLVDRLKKIQTRYFIELTSGFYDIGYFENRLRVGLTHQRVGLEPQWYLGAYQKYLSIATRILQATFRPNPGDFLETLEALTKVIFLDMSLAIDAYIFSDQEVLARKAGELERANEHMRRLDAAKRHLTGAIVHDLQNPLAGIIAFLQVLEARPGGLTEGEQRSLREALARCQDLSTLIVDVLQMNRAEEGRLELYLENLDLVEIGRSATEAFALVAGQARKELVFRGPEAPVVARTDQSLLRRILYNLIRNALQHTPAGTRVEVTVHRGNPWCVCVSDDGPGIPREIQASLFEPGALRRFGYQVESGIGLVFCKRAAEALGLDLRLVSDAGKGTCFKIEPAPADKLAEPGKGDAPG